MSHSNVKGTPWSKVVAGTGIVAVCYGMARFGVGLAAPQLANERVATQGQIAIASSASYVTYVLACFLSSAMLRKNQWRLSIILSALSAVCGCLLLAAAHSSGLFITGAFTAGSAAGFASGAIAHQLARDVPSEREPRAQAIANAGTGFGVAVATAVVLASESWRMMFVIAAALVALFVVLFIARKPELPRGQVDAVEQPGAYRALTLPITCTLLMGAGSSVFWTFGRALVEKAADLTPTASLAFWGAIGIFGVLGALSGDATKHLGTHASWALSSVFVGLSIITLPHLTVFPYIVLAGAIFGAFYVILCGLTIELARDAWPQAVGTSTSILFATIAVGQAIGTALTSLSAAGDSLSGIFLLGGIATGSSAVLVWFIRSNTRRSEPGLECGRA